MSYWGNDWLWLLPTKAISLVVEIWGESAATGGGKERKKKEKEKEVQDSWK